MDIFEKLKNGVPVDMMSEEYQPVIKELNRANIALYHINHTEPMSDGNKEAMDELFGGSYPEGRSVADDWWEICDYQAQFYCDVHWRH